MIGKTISHYKILEKLGEGGMGVVYKAEDTKLKRIVALKFLTPQALESEEEKVRFIHEAQAASALDHPNICTIHEIDETDDGQMFICMAYYDGETLNKKIERGPLRVEEAVDIAIKIAQGLTTAHAEGIVHRDIKPANIMVTKDGVVKILDFGLAILLGAKRMTKTGMTRGTLSYISPEQIRRFEIDHRTDIWSFGVLLYELLTGQQPFGGEYEAAVLYSIVNEEPIPPTQINPSTPTELERIINKALQKQVEDRYASVQEMIDEMKQIWWHLGFGIQSPIELAKREPLRRPLRKTILILTAVLLTSIVAFAFTYFLLLRDDIGPISVMVLDFENHTQDRDPALTGILAELLSANLAQSPHVKILSKGRMRDLCQELGIESIDLSTGFDLCNQGQVQTLMSTSILQMGKFFRIDVKAFDVTTRDLLFTEHVQHRGQDAILEMIGELSKKIKAKLKVLPRGDVDQLPELPTYSMKAYKLFSLGCSIWTENPSLSEAYFEQALALDSTFVQAYRNLAILYSYIGDSRRAIVNAQRAKEFSRDRGAKEFFKSVIIEYRAQQKWDLAIDYMERYLELDVNDINMRLDLGYVLSRRKKAFDSAIWQFKRIVTLDPENLSGKLGTAYNCLGHANLYLGQFEKAMEAFKQYQSLVPDKSDPLHSIANALSFRGKYKQAIAQYCEIIQKDPIYYDSYGDLGWTYLAIGKWREALSVFKRYITAVPNSLLPYGHILQGRVYYIQENTSLVEKEIEKALALDPQFIRAHWLQGLVALILSRNVDKARQELRIMQELPTPYDYDSEAFACYYHLHGWILLAEDKFAEGLEALRNAVEASPRDFIYFKKELVKGYLTAGLIEEAIREASILLSFNENDGEVLYQLGLAHEKKGSLDKAVRYFRQAQNTWSEADLDFRLLELLQSKLPESP